VSPTTVRMSLCRSIVGLGHILSKSVLLAIEVIRHDEQSTAARVRLHKLHLTHQGAQCADACKQLQPVHVCSNQDG